MGALGVHGLAALALWAAPYSTPVRVEPQLIEAVIEFCLAAAFGTLWWIARDFPIFRSMSLYTGLIGLQLLLLYLGGDAANLTVLTVTTPLILVIAGQAMRISLRGWMAVVWAISGLSFFWNWTPALRFLRDWPINLTQVLLGVMIVVALRRKERRDPWIIASFVLMFLPRWSISPEFQALTGVRPLVRIGAWQWPITPMTSILMGVVTLGIFVRELVRDRREKLRLATELEAARAVQQVLVPEEIPAVPGFAIAAVYRPFGEVGGDFFQILPIAGGVLVVIGDVSGKGMPAAMTVSLLVGTVRTLAHYTQSPGEILAAMNARMIGRSSGGFTTCLVLRADADGRLTLANAGHIAPFVAGRELAVESGLPLGLAAGVEYAEEMFELGAGEQLTLVTDGVVEARSKSGELLGFERTAELSAGSAEALAQAAQAFGQDDDITVLTIVREP